MKLVKQKNLDSTYDEDLALAQAVGRCDRKAAHRLADRLFSRVRAIVLYMAPGHRDADDMIQRALIEVLRASNSYRGECSLERWADTIVSRTVMRTLKRRKKKDFFVQSGAEPDESGVEEFQEVAVSRGRTRKRLKTILDRLSEKRRVVVVLHWMHGYTVAEIAEIVDAPINTVRDRLHKGKRKLKKWIKKDPVLCDWLESVNHENR